LSSQSSPSSQAPHHHDGHGKAIAVTIQFPHTSDTGDGMFNHTFCNHKHIAIQTCAVRVGAA
jgi:hypothetical protein